METIVSGRSQKGDTPWYCHYDRETRSYSMEFCVCNFKYYLDHTKVPNSYHFKIQRVTLTLQLNGYLPTIVCFIPNVLHDY